nr:hypothetical protein [Shewanella violacea]
MKQLKSSLSLQLVFAIVGALAILLAIISVFLVNGESDRTRQQIDADLSVLVQVKSNEVTRYFVEKAKVIDSVFASPQVLDWFSQYKRRLSNLDRDGEYQSVIQYFKHFSNTDSDIKSVFFGSANTFEYFDLNGRYNDGGLLHQ